MAKLILASLFSAEVELETWRPASKESIYVCLDLQIGMSDIKDSTNMFYVTLATAEAIKSRGKPKASQNAKVLLVHDFDYGELQNSLGDILNSCTRETWDESCLALSKYFQWEYEGYIVD